MADRSVKAELNAEDLDGVAGGVSRNVTDTQKSMINPSFRTSIIEQKNPEPAKNGPDLDTRSPVEKSTPKDMNFVPSSWREQRK